MTFYKIFISKLNRGTLLLSVLFLLLFQSCKKGEDFLLSEGTKSESVNGANVDSRSDSALPVSIEEAKAAFKEWKDTPANEITNTGTYFELMRTIKPLWDFPNEPVSGFNNTRMVTFIPVYPIPALQMGPQSESKLYFTRDNTGKVIFNLQINSAESNYYKNKGGKPKVADYTGYVFHISPKGTTSPGFAYNNGILTKIYRIGAVDPGGEVPVPNPNPNLGGAASTSMIHCYFCPEDLFSEGAGSGGGFQSGGPIGCDDVDDFLLAALGYLSNPMGGNDAPINVLVDCPGQGGSSGGGGGIGDVNNWDPFSNNNSPVPGATGSGPSNGPSVPTFSNTYSDPAIVRQDIITLLNLITDPTNNYEEPECYTGLNQTIVNNALTDQMLSWLGNVPGAVNAAATYLTSCPFGSGTSNFMKAIAHMKAVLEFSVVNQLTNEEFVFLLAEQELFDAIKEFGTKDDVAFLIENPEIKQEFENYIEQNPNATTEQIKFFLRISEEAPDKPMNSEELAQRLNCFVANSGGNAQVQTVRLMVDQPIYHDPRIVDDRSGPIQKISHGGGHTWLEITQQINGVETVLNVGFYPQNSASPLDQEDPGSYNDDTEHQYDVAMGFNLTDAQFNSLIMNLKNATLKNYHLSNFNCTTWAKEQLGNIGLNIKTNIVSATLFSGFAPSQLGEDLRNNFGQQPMPHQLFTPSENTIGIPSSCN
jgi:hypothetical protein